MRERERENKIIERKREGDVNTVIRVRERGRNGIRAKSS